MEFCVISPTAGLEKYARLSKTHLVLGHMCSVTAYREFYQQRKADGDFIILDNGAYEYGRPSISWEAIQALEPDVVVLPDYLLQPWQKTWHAAIAFLDEYSHDAQEFEWLYIPQAEKGDLHGFLQSYQEAVADPRITWIGIPRALAYAITDNPLARVEFARLVKWEHPTLNLHAFGMVNGDVHELGYLRSAGVRSIDSSAPVWRGWNGYQMRDWQAWNDYGTPVDFNAVFKAGNRPDYRESNLHEVLEACGVRIPTR